MVLLLYRPFLSVLVFYIFHFTWLFFCLICTRHSIYKIRCAVSAVVAHNFPFLLKPQCGHRSEADGEERGAVTDPGQVEQYPENPEQASQRFASPLQQARQLSFLAKEIISWCERGGEEA